MNYENKITRKCTICNSTKDIERFSQWKEHGRIKSRRKYCKSCQIEREKLKSQNKIRCKKCNEIKFINEFYANRTSLITSCKECCKIYRKERYIKDVASIPNFKAISNKKTLARRRKHPEQFLLIGARTRAKKKGLEFNITIDDIIIPEKCPVLGIKLKPSINGQGPKNNSPTLDRIDNSKGYIKGNVMVISWRANCLKSNGKIKEFELILEFMKKYLTNKE